MRRTSEPSEFALNWCRRLGAKVDTLVQLGGGINNQVYHCSKGKNDFVLKEYSSIRTDANDRFISEIEFLSYTNTVAPQYVPKIIEIDIEGRGIVLEYCAGEQFTSENTPSEGEILQAAKFLECINANHSLAQETLTHNAAEGYSLITDHVCNIEERLSKLDPSLSGTDYLVMQRG